MLNNDSMSGCFAIRLFHLGSFHAFCFTTLDWLEYWKNSNVVCFPDQNFDLEKIEVNGTFPVRIPVVKCSQLYGKTPPVAA